MSGLAIKPDVPCIVFHCPQEMHILTGCPADLVRYESTQPNHHFARIEIRRLEKRYAPKNPSGYPATVYKYCTESEWKEYWNNQDQLTLGLLE